MEGSAAGGGEPLVPVLVSIQVGLPRRHGEADGSGSWFTAFHKNPIPGPVWLGATQLAGDGQADPRYHGGPDRAVLAYAAGHYPLWRAELERPDLPYGGFAENFTISGQTEDTVCLGDIYAVGDARVQVSSPRGPCWKIARRWGISDLTARVKATGRTGWYLRVLEEGLVQTGDPVILRDRPYPRWTVTRVAAIHRQRHDQPGPALELAACPVLGGDWRIALETAGKDAGSAPA